MLTRIRSAVFGNSSRNAIAWTCGAAAAGASFYISWVRTAAFPCSDVTSVLLTRSILFLPTAECGAMGHLCLGIVVFCTLTTTVSWVHVCPWTPTRHSTKIEGSDKSRVGYSIQYLSFVPSTANGLERSHRGWDCSHSGPSKALPFSFAVFISVVEEECITDSCNNVAESACMGLTWVTEYGLLCTTTVPCLMAIIWFVVVLMRRNKSTPRINTRAQFGGV